MTHSSNDQTNCFELYIGNDGEQQMLFHQTPQRRPCSHYYSADVVHCIIHLRFPARLAALATAVAPVPIPPGFCGRGAATGSEWTGTQTEGRKAWSLSGPELPEWSGAAQATRRA